MNRILSVARTHAPASDPQVVVLEDGMGLNQRRNVNKPYQFGSGLADAWNTELQSDTTFVGGLGNV